MADAGGTEQIGAERLPQLHGHPMVTDGGMETDLIFHHGVDLPDFAAFPLLDDAAGRATLTNYYDGYAAIARQRAVGLLLESPTWRANPDWRCRLGYAAADLARVNAAAVELLAVLRESYAPTIAPIVLSGMIGPRGDGYRPGSLADPKEAQTYHAPQIEALARAGADLVTAYTLNGTAEAIGIVRAARDAGIPVAISFTVEVDGRLATGANLGQAIDEIDATARPDYFLLNCAHPDHVRRAVAESGSWRERILGIRCNASTKSHAELDDANELDEGDPATFAASHDRLIPLLPRLTVIGGCCGTDTRHVAAVWARRSGADGGRHVADS